MIWFTSDWHLNHRGICKGTSNWTESIPPRNFSSVEEMNSTILGNLNSLVKEKDTLYNLGDVIFGTVRNIPDLLGQIKCRNVHLIYGNHDKKLIKKKWFTNFFKSISSYYELNYNKQKIVLCHYCFCTWNQCHHGSYHAYGHSHGNLPDRDNRSMDVGVDCHDYKPISLDEFLETLKSRPFMMDGCVI